MGTPEKRMRMLHNAFRNEKTVMVVQAKDLVDEEGEFDLELGEEETSMDFSEANGSLLLTTTQGERHVPNCCAVCLGAYNVGDRVVWSSNPDCSHAFHEECVTDWLIKMQEGSPCPCCRQCFVDVGDEEDKKGKLIEWESGHTMDLNVVSL